jgi:DNA polymerase-3 subunit delta'
MITEPINQLKLLGHERHLLELIRLYDDKKFPNKILLTGDKGIGKSTLAHHLINYILSKNKKFAYDLDNFQINKENKSFKLVMNKSNPNLYLIDVLPEKKKIDVNQIRDLIGYVNKSSFNKDPRFILIDNIEYLNINSINALLKILEEPNPGIFFILINNNIKILPTLKSRCLNFKISLSNKECLDIINALVDDNIYNIINEDLINYYNTPGQLFNIVCLSKEFKIDLTSISLNNFLYKIINENFYKKNLKFKFILYESIQLFFRKNIHFFDKNLFLYYLNFIKKIENTKKFNLDEESIFLEFNSKFLNG